MNFRRLLLLLVALVAAVGTAAVARKFINSPQATAKPSPQEAVNQPSNEVLVAANDLPAGRIVEKGDLKFRSWPQDGLTEGYVLKAVDAEKPFIGAVVRRGIVKGEPLTDARVVKPGERGFLAAIVEPGHRAISVPVNATTGVSGLFFPGDQVDVILTHTVQRDKVDRHVSETILRDVRVLAVDQRVEDIDGKAQVAKTATLEVTPKEAEVIAMLSDLGKLSLSLRSVAKPEGEDEMLDLAQENVLADSFTLDSEVSRVLHNPPTSDGQPKVEVSVIRGGKTQDMSFSLAQALGSMFGGQMGGTSNGSGGPSTSVTTPVDAMRSSTATGLEQVKDTGNSIVEGE